MIKHPLVQMLGVMLTMRMLFMTTTTTMMTTMMRMKEAELMLMHMALS